MNRAQLGTFLKRAWRFLWHDESVWSWVANVVIAFVLIKFVVYPGLGWLLGTPFPIVAVVSGSMEHRGGFDTWWADHEKFYEQHGIANDVFKTFPFSNGFNKGDIMILRGLKKENIKKGTVIVFHTSRLSEPVIHRIVEVGDTGSTVTTKGDFNSQSHSFEQDIPLNQIIGEAVVKIPYLGYIKIWFVQLLNAIGVGSS
ncbi:MAG: signal peptidase I [Candidatus Woesearchaeota archaeon]|nr:signal peptidase I [Candidatus Woesearchaeota archaeon]